MTTDTASIRKQATNSKKPETSFSENRCERCNAELTNERVSVRETLLNAACFLLLLTFLAPLGYVAEQWIQRHLDRPLWHPLWHEPLDNCSGYRAGVASHDDSIQIAPNQSYGAVLTD